MLGNLGSSNLKSRSQKISALTTRNGSSPSKGSALAIPPAVSSACVSGEYARCTPKRAPSLSADSIKLPRCAWLMTISLNPAAARFSRIHTMSGLPPAGSKALGRASLNGRIRSPRPAARIIAFTFAISKAVTHLHCPPFQLTQQLQQRRKIGVALAGSTQVLHHQRQILEVSIFAVTVIQAGEDAQHLQMPLHSHPLEIAVELRKIGL